MAHNLVFNLISVCFLLCVFDFGAECGLLGKADQYYFMKMFGGGGDGDILEQKNVKQNTKSSESVETSKNDLFLRIRNIDVEQNGTNFMSLMDEKFYYIDEETIKSNLKNKESRLNHFNRYRSIDTKALIVPYVEKKFQLIMEKNAFDENTPENHLTQWLNEYMAFRTEIRQLSRKIILTNLNEYMSRYSTIFDNRLGATIQFSSGVHFSDGQVLKFVLQTKIPFPEHQFYSLKQLLLARKLLSLISDSLRLLLENGDKTPSTNLEILRFFVNCSLMELSEIPKLNKTLLSDDLIDFGKRHSQWPADETTISNLRLRLDLETKLLKPSFFQSNNFSNI